MTSLSARAAHRAGLLAALLAALLSASLAAPAVAVSQLHRGDVPPAVTLPTIDGTDFTLTAHAGTPGLLLFGELYHERSLEAARAVQALLADPRIAPIHPFAVLIVTQQAEPAALRALAQRQGVTLPVLHDADRKVFAAYQVSVLPSAVVVDGRGRVVHAVASLSPQLREMLTDALLYAAGQLDLPQLERTLHPTSAPTGGAPERRAERLVELAQQLVRGGMADLASDKYREALTIDAKCVAARVGLGRIALRKNQLADAEQQFRAALAADSKAATAALGLAYVQALRGGADLPRAEQAVRALLVERPNDAEAHFVLGLICEQAGRAKDAAASYRRSAELMLERGGHE